MGISFPQEQFSLIISALHSLQNLSPLLGARIADKLLLLPRGFGLIHFKIFYRRLKTGYLFKSSVISSQSAFSASALNSFLLNSS